MHTTTGLPPAQQVRAPAFSAAFKADLHDLLIWRRDVRHFRKDPVDANLIEQLIGQACLAPSVGNAQPWRFVTVHCPQRRQKVADIFTAENADAASKQAPEREAAYRQLKLAGLAEAPVQLAVFCDEAVNEGYGLGRRTMPQALHYSVVCAVHTFWLAARAEGLGAGWVSILDPAAVCTVLEVPPAWTLIGYFCVGWPLTDETVPELQRTGWQERLDPSSFLTRR